MFFVQMLASRPTDHQTLQPTQGQTSQGCIIHDTVVGLCSELLKKVILLQPSSVWKKVFDSHGNRTRDLSILSRLPKPLDQGSPVVSMYASLRS